MSMHRRRRKIFTCRLLEGLKTPLVGACAWPIPRGGAAPAVDSLASCHPVHVFFHSHGSLRTLVGTLSCGEIGWMCVLRLGDFHHRHQNHIAFNITRGSENLFVDVELCLVDLVKKGTNDSGNAPQFHVSLAGEVSVTILASKATNASTSGSRITPILQSKL